MKNKFFVAFVLISVAGSHLFAQPVQTLWLKFVKGNISEKTAAVKDADGEDKAFLSQKALEFVLDNKEFVAHDRDFAMLAVAGVLSLPDEYFAAASKEKKLELEKKLAEIFQIFSDGTVKIAVTTKTMQVAKQLAGTNLTEVLNDFVVAASENETTVLQNVLQALAVMGNADSLKLVYSAYEAQKFASSTEYLENTLAALAPNYWAEVYQIITSSSLGQIRLLFDVFQKKSKNNKNFCAEIAENVLFFTIYKAGNPEQKSEELALQLDCVEVLAEYSWTRAQASVLAFFDIAQKAHEDGQMSDEDFVKVISKIAVLSPINASQKLSQYLSVLNSSKENASASSDNVVRGVIVALGEIGNKQAFDSLLAVTYLDYPEDIVALARDSLARLRW